MRIVVALGGNALLRRGEPLTAANQRANVRRACAALAPLAAGNELVVTHGNGPQVGLLALQGEAYGAVPAYPLDVLGAETEGMIGYLVEQELGNLLPPGRPLATILTMVEVDPADPAFARPSKPIGPVYPAQEGESLAAERGWVVRPDGGGVRRVVASPLPRRVVELRPVRWLLERGCVVVCAGGGGIPVRAAADGRLEGVEAVIDKDRASALLAAELEADALVLATDVDGVYAGFGTPQARRIARMPPGALPAGELPDGSMGPKVEAAGEFVLRTGGRAAIGALEDVVALAAGTTGTVLDASAGGIELAG